jgi:pyridoxamine 5'-phosphate oxidase
VDALPEAQFLEEFAAWFKEARAAEPLAEACALATVGADGTPSLRMVLMKGFDARGFVFYTNSDSRKGQELARNPHAALCFYWKKLGRQVRVEGPVERVSAAEADAYFASRPRDSQIGAWASAQSRPLASRAELERLVAETTARFAGGAVPRPENWPGYRVKPDVIEFWQDQPFRLHDRIVYRREAEVWKRERLFP